MEGTGRWLNVIIEGMGTVIRRSRGPGSIGDDVKEKEMKKAAEGIKMGRFEGPARVNIHRGRDPWRRGGQGIKEKAGRIPRGEEEWQEARDNGKGWEELNEIGERMKELGRQVVFVEKEGTEGRWKVQMRMGKMKFENPYHAKHMTIPIVREGWEVAAGGM